MKVYISADIEGITGIVSWSQCGRPDSNHFDYRWARERMTADVNAAIRGARAGGATEVVVKDSHGNSKNLLVDQLEPGTTLISGWGAGTGGMMNGIDRTVGAAVLVGYHAMAGTPAALLEHTLTGYVHRMTLNGMPAGEIALSAGMAACYGVPIVAISSDRAGCAEAKALVPNLATAEVKDAIGRYVGHLLHPSETELLIFEAVRDGVERYLEIDPWLPEPPVTVRLEFNRCEEAEMAARLIGVRRVDGYTCETIADTFAQAHQAAWAMIGYAGNGHGADQ